MHALIINTPSASWESTTRKLLTVKVGNNIINDLGFIVICKIRPSVTAHNPSREPCALCKKTAHACNKNSHFYVAYRLWRPLLLLLVEESRIVDALDLCEYALRWKERVDC